jgi:hypothetical protein
MTMTGSVKLKLTEVDGGIEARHNCYVCVSCGTAYALEELAPIRIHDLFARVAPGAEMPAGECPNENCPEAVESPYGPAALCYSAEEEPSWDGEWECVT